MVWPQIVRGPNTVRSNRIAYPWESAGRSRRARCHRAGSEGTGQGPKQAHVVNQVPLMLLRASKEIYEPEKVIAQLRVAKGGITQFLVKWLVCRL